MKKIFLIFLTCYLFIPSIANAADEELILEYFMIQNENTSQGIVYFKSMNYNKALDFFISKAEEGDMDSAVNAGIIYEHIEKNDLLALKYYKIAAENGNIHGEYNYGVMLYYLNNIIESYKWLLCAAKHQVVLAKDSINNMKDKKLITEVEILKATELSKNCM